MHKKRVGNRYYFYTTKRSDDGKRTRSIYLGKNYKFAKLKEIKLNKPQISLKESLIPQQILIVLLVTLGLFLIYFVFTFPTYTGFTTYTISSSGNYDSLEQCLFFANSTSDTCQIDVSNYDETLNSVWFSSPSTQYNLTGMVFGYDFETNTSTNITDISGNNIESNFSTGNPIFTPFIVNKGYEMDGNNDYTITTYDDMMNSTQGVAYGGYVNVSNDVVSVFFDIGLVPGRRAGYTASTDTFFCRMNSPSLGVNCATTSTISLNKIYHIMCTYNQSDILVYLNGKLDSNCALGTSLRGVNGNNVIIGANGNGAQDFNGTIDNFVYYNRSLTSDEIKSMAYGHLSKYESKVVNDTNMFEIADGVENVSINLNGSYFMGNKAGTFLETNGAVTLNTKNITINNAYVDSFVNNVVLSGNNITLINITSINGISMNFNIGLRASNNLTLRDSYSLSSFKDGIYINSLSNKVYILNVNSSDNIEENVETHASSQNITIRDSFFINSTTQHCLGLYGQNYTLINNTIKNCLTDEKAGILSSNNNFFYLIENNTFENNNINAYFISMENSTIKNNIFNISYDSDISGTLIGTNVFLDGGLKNQFINNSFYNSVENGLVISKISSGNSYSANNNITGNTFTNTTLDGYGFDLYLVASSTSYNSTVWLNHFYNNISFVGVGDDFCVNDEGNFYEESIGRTTLNETDCGLVNITTPDGFENINYTPYSINWTKQSSIYTINYSLYYSDNTGITYNYINSTTSLEYNWNFSGLANASNYLIKIIPYDGIVNGTNENSTQTFTLLTSPTINLIAPNNNTGDNDGNITFDYNISHLNPMVNCSLRINDNLNQTNTTIVKGITLNFEINNTAIGSYNWSVRCSDVANIRTSERRIFSVVNTTSFLGATTNLSNVGDISNVTNFVIENLEYGKINFSENVNLSMGIDINTNINISNNRIYLNNSIADINKAARLSFYNITYTDPQPLKDSIVCPSTICTEVSYSNNIFIYDVTGFSVYSAQETPVSAVTAAAAGGGGGGGVSYSRIRGGFKTDKQQIMTKLSLEETKTETITIQNQDLNIISININTDENIKRLVELSSQTFELRPGEEKVIKIKIKSSEYTGIYTGNLVIKAEAISKEIPLVIEIQSKDSQIDTSLDLPLEYKQVKPGQKISAQITLFDIGDHGKLQTSINYIIKSIGGNEIITQEEKIILDKQTSFTRTFILPKDIPKGVYIIGIEVMHANSISISTQIFEVIPEKLIKFPSEKQAILFVLFNLFIILIFISVIKFIKKKI